MKIRLILWIKINVEGLYPLRLNASYGDKITKIQTPLVRFAWLFHNQNVFQQFEHTFFDIYGHLVNKK